MLSERPLFIAIIISIFVHGIILLQMPEFKFIVRQEKPTQVEIKYIEKTDQKKEVGRKPAPAQAKGNLKARREPLIKLPSFVTASNAKLSPVQFTDQKAEPSAKNTGIGRQLGQLGRMFTKPVLPKPDIGMGKKKITLAPPKENLNKINSPSYIGYFQLTRERVKRVLYEKYTYTEEGEVYLSFIVNKEGVVKDIRIDEERSSQSLYLREIAVASVRAASPFPVFPQDLQYPELSFNVIVSFEVE